MGIPSGFNRSGKHRLESAAWRLASEMRLARQTAIMTGVTSRIQFRWFNNDYKVSLSGGKETIALPEGINYASINFPVVDSNYLLEFKSTGAPNRGGTVGLKTKRGERLYVIVTPATGRVRVSAAPPQ